ncbi:MAG: NUDIX domain-containing protein [Candidatus Chromulinivorax sp.]
MSQQRFKIPFFTNIIVRSEDKVLLVKRKDNQICGGFYAFAGGGVDGKEPVTVAAAREAFEELGILIDPKELKFVHVYHFFRPADTEYINFFFEVREWQGQIENKEPEKCDEVVWFDLNHLPDKLLPGHAQVIQMLAKKQVFSEFGW